LTIENSFLPDHFKPSSLLGISAYRLGQICGATSVFFKSFVGDRPRGLRISPDGSKIALTIYGPGIDPTSVVNYPHFWMMNVDGSNLRQLTTSNSNDDVGDFSPDR
jgi:hypothetical protein